MKLREMERPTEIIKKALEFNPDMTVSEYEIYLTGYIDGCHNMMKSTAATMVDVFDGEADSDGIIEAIAKMPDNVFRDNTPIGSNPFMEEF